MINEATNSVLIPSYFKFYSKNGLMFGANLHVVVTSLFIVEYLNTKLYPEEEY